MANDAYLKIEGLSGESTDDKHREWIEVSNVLYAYAKIKWNYLRQSIRGGTQGNTSGGWDCSANKVC